MRIHPPIALTVMDTPAGTALPWGAIASDATPCHSGRQLNTGLDIRGSARVTAMPARARIVIPVQFSRQIAIRVTTPVGKVEVGEAMTDRAVR